MLLRITTLLIVGTAVAALSCPPGKVLHSSRRRRRINQCVACARGRFSVSAEQCFDCPTGKFAEQEGQVLCSGGPVCAAGYQGTARASSRAEAEKCAPCPPGKYQPVSGQSDCLRCLGGMYSGTKGSANCLGVACSAGRFSDVSLATLATDTACADCPVEQYTSHVGAWTCSACPRGKHQYQPAMNLCDADPSCARFNYWSPAVRSCVSRHAYVRELAAVAWTLFALGILMACTCCCDSKVCTNESTIFIGILLTIHSMAVGIETTRTANTKVKESSFYIMISLLAVPLLGILYTERQRGCAKVRADPK